MRNESIGREDIIKVTRKMVESSRELESITIRQIAEAAGVGVGLINYHFKTKDQLMNMVIGDMISEIASSFNEELKSESQNPVDLLKSMLKSLFLFGVSHEKYMKYILLQGLSSGDISAPLRIVPILKRIYKGKKSEFLLRTIALQIVIPIQFASLNPENFNLYSGVNLKNDSERNHWIDVLVDQVIGEK